MLLAVWWGCLDLNQGPIGYEPTALTTELHPLATVYLLDNYNRWVVYNNGVLPEIQSYAKRFKDSLNDVRNVVLYIFAVIVLAITWSGIKAVQANYELQKKISVLQQQNGVLKLQNQTAALQNEYYKTDQYQELAARQDLGLAAPGEKVMLVPGAVAAKYIEPGLMVNPPQAGILASDSRSKYVRNLEAWRDFLLGRRIFSQ